MIGQKGWKAAIFMYLVVPLMIVQCDVLNSVADDIIAWYAANGTAYTQVFTNQKIKENPPDPFPLMASVAFIGSDGTSFAKADADLASISGNACAQTWEFPMFGNTTSIFVGGFAHNAPLLIEFKSHIYGKLLGFDCYIDRVTNNKIKRILNYNLNTPTYPPALAFKWLPGSYSNFTVSLSAGAYACYPPYDSYGPYSSYSAALKFHSVGGAVSLNKVPLKNGIWLMVENNPLGMRVYRQKVGESNRYVALCAYDYAQNIGSIIGDNFAFRWKNTKYDENWIPLRVDVYTYYPLGDLNHIGQEWLNRRSFSWDQYEEDQERFIYGTVTWDGPPPLGSDDLLNGLNLSSSITDFTASDYVPLADSLMEYAPGAFITCTNIAVKHWFYSLMINDASALIVSGDTIKFEGPGISGGMVQGNATLGTYGAWSVQESSPGIVIFVANNSIGAPTGGVIDGFVVMGKSGSVNGTVNYTTRGYWIGISDSIAGPKLPANISCIWLLLSD